MAAGIFVGQYFLQELIVDLKYGGSRPELVHFDGQFLSLAYSLLVLLLQLYVGVLEVPMAGEKLWDLVLEHLDGFQVKFPFVTHLLF